jgi:hypothetical protein
MKKIKLLEKAKTFLLYLFGGINILRLSVSLGSFYLSILHSLTWGKWIMLEDLSLVQIYLDISDIFQRACFFVYVLGIGFRIDWNKDYRYRFCCTLKFWTKYFDFYSKAKDEA